MVRDDDVQLVGDPSPVEVSTGAGDTPDDPDDLEGVVAAVAGTVLADLARARNPLQGELVLGGVMGALDSGLPQDADDAERHAALVVLLAQLTEHCLKLRTPAALAFLRVAARLGPAPARLAAGQAADQLAAAGVGDLPWAGRVGSPVLLRAWRYGDVLGAQSSVGLLFDYQNREHGVSVLIDHDLGGGIKDAWIAEGRDARRLRDHIATSLATEDLSYFEDLTAHQALQALRTALAAPPCPEQPDQVEDVAAHLYLVHSRAQLLADTLGEEPVELYAGQGPEDDAQPVPTSDILRIKVTIAGTKPPIWRRLEVPAATNLARLHAVLQAAFGWDDAHLHAFETGHRSWGEGPAGRRLEGPTLRRTSLDAVAGSPGDQLTYVYDFGDDWVHSIHVEDRLTPADDATYPRCTAGRRAGPPEDCGGVPGYEHLLSVLADPQHPEHEDLSEWAGPVDPAAFDRDALNRALGRFDDRARS